VFQNVGIKKLRALCSTMVVSRQRTWPLLLVWWIGLTALLLQNKDLRRLLPYHDRSLLQADALDLHASQTVKDDNAREGLAACLLVMDDNHFLIEWLAYHYFVGPLKSLVIAVDPRSSTNVASIVERYRDTPLNITVWYNNDYYKAFEVHQVQELMQQGPSDLDVRLHRKRQRIFFDRCLRHHQHHDWTYTLLSDTDEFLLVNYDTISARNITLAPLPISEPGSVWHALQHQANNDTWTTAPAPCLQIPRVRFGSVELPRNDDVAVPWEWQILVNVSHLATYRWRTHASDTDYMTNKLSKALVDVSRLDTKFPPVTSMHRPIKSLCTAEKLLILPSQQVSVCVCVTVHYGKPRLSTRIDGSVYLVDSYVCADVGSAPLSGHVGTIQFSQRSSCGARTQSPGTCGTHCASLQHWNHLYAALYFFSYRSRLLLLLLVCMYVLLEISRRCCSGQQCHASRLGRCGLGRWLDPASGSDQGTAVPRGCWSRGKTKVMQPR
jgi:hypothetical protein